MSGTHVFKSILEPSGVQPEVSDLQGRVEHHFLYLKSRVATGYQHLGKHYAGCINLTGFI